MAGQNIKLNAEETLGHVSKIAATMAEVSVPGPVPPPAPGASPIDAALNTVALGGRREGRGVVASAVARAAPCTTSNRSRLSSRCRRRKKRTLRQITEIQSQVPQAGLTTL